MWCHSSNRRSVPDVLKVGRDLCNDVCPDPGKVMSPLAAYNEEGHHRAPAIVALAANTGGWASAGHGSSRAATRSGLVVQAVYCRVVGGP